MRLERRIGRRRLKLIDSTCYRGYYYHESTKYFVTHFCNDHYVNIRVEFLIHTGFYYCNGAPIYYRGHSGRLTGNYYAH